GPSTPTAACWAPTACRSCAGLPRRAGARSSPARASACGVTSESAALGRLRGFPEAVLLLGGGVAHGAPLGGERLLEVGEAAAEALGGGAQGALGVEAQLAGQVDGGEEDVAQLALDVGLVAGGERVVQLVQLLVDLPARPAGVGPVEADGTGLLAGAAG